tara:strand:- start:1001 stop:1819 length:819 start_codon:yes stop_codon:yes gene_type:complete
MKHNKKRNTAFIYEMLSKELTKSIVNENAEIRDVVVAIIKEHFSARSPLAEELKLYRTLLETKNVQTEIANKLLQETKIAHARLDSATTFDAQSRVISMINKKLGTSAWGNFVSNFKSLASVNAIFNTKTPIKSKVLFEQSIVDAMSASTSLVETNKLESVDNLIYHSFIKKFNNKYTDLLKEQKDLLNRYITSFADDGFELRLYLNEELGRLKETLSKSKAVAPEDLISEKVGDVLKYLEGFRKRDFGEEDLNKILKTQELVRELETNDQV